MAGWMVFNKYPGTGQARLNNTIKQQKNGKLMESTICNHCGDAEAKHLYTLPDLLLERKDIQGEFVRCKTCDLIYQNPRPTQAEMQQHYPPEYESYADSRATDKATWLLRKVYTYGTTKRARVVTRAKKSGRILDIGCASGIFLLGMKSRPGWEAIGVEINPHAANIAKENQLDVFTGTLDAAAFPSNWFDAVTLWDVLEHLHDPTASLREIHRILKPDGILVIRVPNVSSRDAKWFGPTWAGWDSPRHLYVFGIDTLRKILETNNFQIENMSCEIGSYPTFVLSVRFWLYHKKVNKKTREKISKWLYSPFMRMVTAPIFYLLGLGLRGPLITVTARKEAN